MRTVLRVRELNAAGWTPTQMLEVLEREGFSVPSLTTIYLWLRPDYRERSKQATARRAARRSAATSDLRWPAKRSPEWKVARMRQLRDETCLSFAAIAAVMTHDFPDTPVTARSVEHTLKHGGTPRTLREAA